MIHSSTPLVAMVPIGIALLVIGKAWGAKRIEEFWKNNATTHVMIRCSNGRFYKVVYGDTKEKTPGWKAEYDFAADQPNAQTKR